jgi:uncharacterized protein with GYD domain
MAWFMVQVSYAPDAWAAQIKQPHDRIDALRKMLEPAGITIDHAWYSFGEYDLVLICQAPGNTEAAGAVLAAAAGGALKANKTTPLLSVDEGRAAMQTANQIAYRPPGQ